MVGRLSDMSIVRYLYTWLVLECRRLSEQEAKGSGSRIFVASYCNGFVAGIREQLRISRAELKTTATISSIVKIDSRLEESTSAMNALHKDLKTVNRTIYHRVNHDAFNQGKTRGQQVHLGASMSASGARLLNK